MDRLRIEGGIALRGEIEISGAKNAALKLMAAALLTDEELVLSNVPNLADVKTMEKLLAQHGVAIEHAGNTYTLQAKDITSLTAPYELVRQMRASVVVLGPLLARFHEAKVSLPGGCAIGTRPIDMHIHALEQMGAKIDLAEGYVVAKAPKGLKGADIAFEKVSVGATENILMAATLARGVTTITNAAREPEIVDLAHCLVAMGAQIEGIGTSQLRVTGVEKLHGANHRVVADRIEAGTFMAAAAMTKGDLELIGARFDHMESIIEKFVDAGVSVKKTERGVRVKCDGALKGIDVMTMPYPGFPTDMQAQFMAMLAIADGASLVTETIFENRFMHVPEMSRMGAHVVVHGGRSAMIRGVKQLTGAEVMATDLRASVSLVLCALVAKSPTIINRIYHLDRGYERLEEKLGACGAKIERIH